VPDFSAVGYYFARELYRRLKVPIGVIDSSWGATPAEAWTSRSALEADLSLQPILWNWKKILLEYPHAMDKYRKQLHDWENQAAKAKTLGEAEPHRPFPPLGSGHFNTFDTHYDAQNQWTPSGLFNAMIAPLTPFSIRGAIWYQGETNAEPYRALEYRRLFQATISDWRRAWDQGPFPFLFVQLANFRDQESIGLYGQSNSSESPWALLRESQMMALALPNTAMVVAIDIGDATDIHPKNKQEVGRRLSLQARCLAYGEAVVSSGPIYRGLMLEGDRIRVRFDNAGTGLIAKGGTLQGITIAGRDRKFVRAEARVEGNTVVVWSAEVPHPLAVRYAWADNPVAALFNREGLPASPFRTDDWSEVDPPQYVH
jgi:sialate O-acetylesterase